MRPNGAGARDSFIEPGTGLPGTDGLRARHRDRLVPAEQRRQVRSNCVSPRDAVGLQFKTKCLAVERSRTLRRVSMHRVLEK
jgi:hypothetical protein